MGTLRRKHDLSPLTEKRREVILLQVAEEHSSTGLSPEPAYLSDAHCTHHLNEL